MYVCMYICMYVCTCVYMCVHMYNIHMSVYIHWYIYYGMVVKVGYNVFEIAKHRRHLINSISNIIITISIYEPLRRTDTKSGTELIFLDYSSIIRLLYLIVHVTLGTQCRWFPFQNKFLLIFIW